jgi:hypothetical protein
MKKLLFIFTLLFFVWAQTSAIAHVYGSEHLYHNTDNTCSKCIFLNQCSGADIPTVVAAPFFDFQSVFDQKNKTEFLSTTRIYSYFSQAPPAVKLI